MQRVDGRRQRWKRNRRHRLAALTVASAVAIGACSTTEDGGADDPVATSAPDVTAPASLGGIFLEPQFEVEVTTDIEYATGDVRDGEPRPLLLDLYEPVGLPGDRPVALLIHGGGFVAGDRDQFELFGRELAGRGFVAIAIQYRLAGDDPEPGERVAALYDLIEGPDAPALFRSIVAAVEDSLAALDWLDAERDDLDWDRLVVGGGSAGAITAANLAYVAPDEGVPGTRPIVGVIDFWGGVNLGETEDYVGPGDPPAFIVHGTADSVVPFRWAQALADVSEEHGLASAFHPVEGADHGVDVTTVTAAGGLTLLEELYHWLDATLYRGPPTG